jgi:transcriptional regulator with XRE-family HTH domain
LRVLEAMHGQVDDQDRPRFTLEQIAAAMSGNVTATTIMNYAPASRRRSGRGGDSRALEPERIAEMRALRAETTQDHKPRYTLRQLAARFGVSDISVSRYCRDIQPGGPVTPRRRRRQPFDAEGNPITVEQVERVQAMRAERNGAGAHRYTREQVAEECLVSVATVKRLERRLTGPPGTLRRLDALSFPDPPASAPRSRATARQQPRSSTPGRSIARPGGAR